MTETVTRWVVRDADTEQMVEINPHQVRYTRSEGEITEVWFARDHKVRVRAQLHEVGEKFAHVFGRPGSIEG